MVRLSPGCIQIRNWFGPIASVVENNIFGIQSSFLSIPKSLYALSVNSFLITYEGKEKFVLFGHKFSIGLYNCLPRFIAYYFNISLTLNDF